MSVVIMICFARSGGTVLNQCLGSLPNVVILSEVNPLGGGGGRGPVWFQTVKDQAKEWYQIDLESDDFIEGILELEQICEDSGRHLVVRDWTFINFVPYENNGWNPPNRLLTLEELEKRCEVIPFAFVRDSIDVWISRGKPPAEDFFRHYLCYVEAILEKKITLFKYENFCRKPSTIIRNICEYSHLEYSASYKNYASFHKVNGDVQIPGGSRGAKQRRIKLLSRQQVPEDKINEVNQNADMARANSLLGYPVSYYDALRENVWSRKIRERINEVSSRFFKLGIRSYSTKLLSETLKRLGGMCLLFSRKLYQSPEQQRVAPWFKDQGDSTLRLNYELDAGSLVFDLGGYRGQWTSDIFSMYCCTIHVFEPVIEFADRIEQRFFRNEKIFVHKFGLSNKNQKVQLAVSETSSSLYKQGNDMREVRLVRAIDFMQENYTQKIDLMKINIEGGEYDLLEHLIDSGFVKTIKNIQVQFHDFVPEAERRMPMIQSELKKTHCLTYQYPFVWENWRLK